MDTELMKWLDMVWGALSEEDEQKRIDLLDNANSLLEQRREQLAPESEVAA